MKKKQRQFRLSRAAWLWIVAAVLLLAVVGQQVLLKAPQEGPSKESLTRMGFDSGEDFSRLQPYVDGGPIQDLDAATISLTEKYAALDKISGSFAASVLQKVGTDTLGEKLKPAYRALLGRAGDEEIKKTLADDLRKNGAPDTARFVESLKK